MELKISRNKDPYKLQDLFLQMPLCLIREVLKNANCNEQRSSYDRQNKGKSIHAAINSFRCLVSLVFCNLTVQLLLYSICHNLTELLLFVWHFFSELSLYKLVALQVIKIVCLISYLWQFCIYLYFLIVHLPFGNMYSVYKIHKFLTRWWFYRSCSLLLLVDRKWS